MIFSQNIVVWMMSIAIGFLAWFMLGTGLPELKTRGTLFASLAGSFLLGAGRIAFIDQSPVSIVFCALMITSAFGLLWFSNHVGLLAKPKKKPANPVKKS